MPARDNWKYILCFKINLSVRIDAAEIEFYCVTTSFHWDASILQPVFFQAWAYFFLEDKESCERVQ